MEEPDDFEVLELVDFQPQNKVLVGERKHLKRGIQRANTTIAMRFRPGHSRGASVNVSSAFQLCKP